MLVASSASRLLSAAFCWPPPKFITSYLKDLHFLRASSDAGDSDGKVASCGSPAKIEVSVSRGENKVDEEK